MFCIQCGNQFSQGAGYCSNCGTAAQRPNSPDPFGSEPYSFSPSVEAQASRNIKLVLPIVAGGSALALAVGGFVFMSFQIPVTAENASSFAVNASDVSFSSEEVSDADFDGTLLDECPVKDQFVDLFSSGETWFEGGFSGQDGSSGFHIIQRIFKVGDPSLLDAGENMIQDVALLEDCDSFSGSSYFNASFDYTNKQDIQAAYNVNLKGQTFDLLTEICVDNSCVDGFTRVGFAYRGNVVIAFKYAGEGSNLREIENAFVDNLRAFAG